MKEEWTMPRFFFLLVGLLAGLAYVCFGQDEEQYAIPHSEWPPNGVPYVGPDGKVFPSYDDRALLTWQGVVCSNTLLL